jgi:hypothetical protein
VKVSFDDRALRRAIQDAANEAVRGVAHDLNHDLNRLSATHRGRSIEDSRGAVRLMFQRNGLKADDTEIEAYAQEVYTGTKFDVRPEPWSGPWH